MTIEERLTRLENFMGDIDRITSLYANTVQEICDKYLNLLYIETYDENNKNILILDGFLSEIDIDKLPKNVIFNVRPSHNFAYQGDVTASKIRFKRDNRYVDLPLKKYDVENPGNLMFLEPDDYLQGTIYNIYINSQDIAIISSNDSGVVALQEVAQLGNELAELTRRFADLSASQSVVDMNANNATINNLTVSNALSLINPIVIPTGSTCATPTAANHPTTMAWVIDKIRTEINTYHRTFHVFGQSDPVPAQLVEGAIYYKYR